MAIRDLFSTKNKYISRKNMRENYRQDPTFQKKIMDSPRLKKILDQPIQQKRVHDLFLEKARDQKVDRQDAWEIARQLEKGKVEGISSTKGRLIAKEFFPSGVKGFEPAKPEPKPEKTPASIPTPEPQPEKKQLEKQKKSTGKSGLLSLSYISYQAKPRSTSNGEKAGNKFSGFYNALRSVGRNRRSQ